MVRYFYLALIAVALSLVAGCASENMTNWGDPCPEKRSQKLSYIKDPSCTAESCALGYYAASFAINQCPADYPHCAQEAGTYFCTDIKCASNQHIEGTTCVDNSIEHCGAQNYACSDHIEGWQSGSCSDGTCMLESCKSDYMLVDGSCVLSTPESCGKDATNCTQTIRGWQNGKCNQGVCMLEQCQSDYVLSEGVCVPNTATACGKDEINCVATVNAWDDGVCQNGICTVSKCLSGHHLMQTNGSFACEKNEVTACGPSDDVNVADCTTLPNIEQSACVAGQCVISSCKPDFHLYENTCEADSEAHCGQHDSTCDGTCIQGRCTQCTNDETSCSVEVTSSESGTHNEAVYMIKKCADSQWQPSEPCPNGWICDETGKSCVDPNEAITTPACADTTDYTVCSTFNGMPYYSVCLTDGTSTACVGDTPYCNIHNGCVAPQECLAEGQLQDGNGGCKCDEANGYKQLENDLDDTLYCIKPCGEDGTRRCNAEGIIEYCADDLWEQFMTCSEACREENPYYYCATTCEPEATLCSQIYDENFATIYIEMNCQTDGYFGSAKLCADGCAEDGKTCKAAITCNTDGGAILGNDGVCICDDINNYYGDPDPVDGSCKKCPDDGYPILGTTSSCACEDTNKTWNSETNECTAAPVS